MTKYKVCRMVGRNPEHPTWRNKGLKLIQKIEIVDNPDICNTLTTVTKDNLILEIKNMAKEYRIRKLTPRECHRLMNVEEKDIDSIMNTVSSSQAYKIAGNAIVVSVLCAIFSQLGIQDKKRWNDLSLEEKENIIYKGTSLENKEPENFLICKQEISCYN